MYCRIPPLMSHLWVIIKKEAKHYWHGTKLLIADSRIAGNLIRKKLHGDDLSRRERRQLVRTVADLTRLVPFLIFIAIPFTELLLPFILKVFPGVLPSTFAEPHKKEEGKELDRHCNLPTGFAFIRVIMPSHSVRRLVL